MTEKLAEMAKFFSDIAEAAKTAKSLRVDNGELFRITEEAKKQAVEIEKLQIPDEPLLHELMQTVRKMRESGQTLEISFRSFTEQVDSLEHLMKTKFQGSDIPREVIFEICESLKKTHEMASNFSETFDEFCKHLTETQELSIRLVDKLKQKEEELLRLGKAEMRKGVWCVLSGTGLLALGYFARKDAWIVAGATKCGIGLKAALDARKLPQLANGIRTRADKLGIIAKNLKIIIDRADGQLKLDEVAIKRLEAALEFFRVDQERNNALAEKDEMLTENKKTIAEMDAELARKNAEIQELKAKLFNPGH